MLFMLDKIHAEKKVFGLVIVCDSEMFQDKR